MKFTRQLSGLENKRTLYGVRKEYRWEDCGLCMVSLELGRQHFITRMIQLVRSAEYLVEQF